MLPNLNGRGLFVFSDPGGAKPVLSLVQIIESNLDFYKIISDRNFSFYRDFYVDVSEPLLSVELEILDAKPDFLFVGTSYTSNIELRYVKEATKLGIKTYAFVDHWTSLRERFLLGNETVYPSTILVIDETAKKKAVDSGIPNDLIEVFANPYHLFIAQWKPSISKKLFFSQFNLKTDGKKIITYAPDPLSNVNGELIYGFDEISATKKLCESIKEMDENYIFLFKPHPNQNLTQIKKVISSRMVLLENDTDTNSLIYYSDLIIGFFSNF